MSVLFSGIQKVTEWVEQNTDPDVKDLWFMGSIWPITIVVILYLYFVLKFGPEFMKYRNPYNIDRIVMIYDAVQVLYSFYLVKEAFRMVWLRDDYRFYCIEKSKDDPELAKQQVFTVYMFLMSKLLDLLDTIFFVLRKKQNQITFLHVYHHTLVIILAWHITNFYSGAQTALFGTINACVHIIMYSYYFLTIINPEYKKAWWKKYLTIIQLVQFVITGLHGIITLFEPDCDFPRLIMLFAIPQDIFMFILFWDFYKKAYIKPKKIKQ
ncbi:elongation of very long chain fatty acids protein 7-like [Melanaphis sacchari]|uniref:elongation of very long chain fatty acids protein 7-like n=1 Tax=Melanaphis sacchari TaxID=742174 RepID=UPI000DC13E9E|nr:elongation of very long chain fatty acids protein 7-like [Melanaphis sacchari]XP_025204864.1 elongation of very long chain fatty acids protein 7-like [Melanaphis sacchari]